MLWYICISKKQDKEISSWFFFYVSSNLYVPNSTGKSLLCSKTAKWKCTSMCKCEPNLWCSQEVIHGQFLPYAKEMLYIWVLTLYMYKAIINSICYMLSHWNKTVLVLQIVLITNTNILVLKYSNPVYPLTQLYYQA